MNPRGEFGPAYAIPLGVLYPSCHESRDLVRAFYRRPWPPPMTCDERHEVSLRRLRVATCCRIQRVGISNKSVDVHGITVY